MLNKKYKYIVFILIFLLLLGCQNDQEKIDKIHHHLEETVLLENEFMEIQDPLQKAEKKEQKLYEESIKLSLLEREKIKKLSEEATKSAMEREKLLKQEKESIDKAYNEFILIEPIVKELENEKLKQKGTSLMTIMEERLNAYHALHEAYMTGIELDIQLYDLLAKKDLTIDELEEHINKLNNQYKKILEEQALFNEKTEEYNERKKDFYKEAGLTNESK